MVEIWINKLLRPLPLRLQLTLINPFRILTTIQRPTQEDWLLTTNTAFHPRNLQTNKRFMERDRPILETTVKVRSFQTSKSFILLNVFLLFQFLIYPLELTALPNPHPARQVLRCHREIHRQSTALELWVDRLKKDSSETSHSRQMTNKTTFTRQQTSFWTHSSRRKCQASEAMETR